MLFNLSTEAIEERKRRREACVTEAETAKEQESALEQQRKEALCAAKAEARAKVEATIAAEMEAERQKQQQQASQKKAKQKARAKGSGAKLDAKAEAQRAAILARFQTTSVMTSSRPPQASRVPESGGAREAENIRQGSQDSGPEG